MTCFEFQNLWQQRLDGDCRADPGVLDRHLAACADCRAFHAAAARLEQGIKLLELAVPPEGSSRRIVERVLADRRSRRGIPRRAVVGAALAASVLVAAFVVYFRWSENRTTPRGVDLPVAMPERQPDPAPAEELEQHVADAGNALLGIWNRTTDQALEPGRALLPSTVEVPTLADAGPWPNPLEQPMPTLSAATQGVSEFEPVVSLGRFVNYFRQDLPSLDPKQPQGL
jgi:hypothetical protein